MSAEGNGTNAIAARNARFTTMNTWSTARSRDTRSWYRNQYHPITAKLRKKLKNCGPREPSAWPSRASVTFGTVRLTTSSVNAMAKTASLKNATRSNSRPSSRSCR